MSTILLADDDQPLRLIMRERLERDGHRVLECGDGFAALEIAMEERPECLVLDVMMPLARGLEVVRQVRRQEDWHPSIVMVSARTRVTDRLNALDAGANVYLEKPVALETLASAVARLTSEAPTTRIVDVLGPVWATLALDRLLERSTSMPEHHTAELRQLFSSAMRTTFGRRTPSLPDAPAGLRVLWEHSLRTLLGDATDPLVPIITEVRIPATEEAVTRLLAAHRSAPRPTEQQTQTWVRTLTRILSTSGTSSSVRPVHTEFAAALRNVMGIRSTPTDNWSAVLADALGHQPLDRRAPGQLLEHTIGRALGNALGFQAQETEIWAQTLARVLAYRNRRDSPADITGQMSALLQQALGGPATSPPQQQRLPLPGPTSPGGT